MGLKFGNHKFEGPFTDITDLREASGVFIIVDHLHSLYIPIDCGESANVKSRIATHDRVGCWTRKCAGALMMAVLYTPELDSDKRAAIVKEIRGAHSFPCGKENASPA